MPLVVAAALLVTGACSDDDDDGGGMFGGGANQEGDSGESGFPGGEDGGGFPGGEEDGGGGFPGGEGDGGGGGYDEAAYSNFMDTCTGYPGASDDLCDCAFSEVVASVPYEEYAEFEAEVAADPSTPLPDFIMDAVSACS